MRGAEGEGKEEKGKREREGRDTKTNNAPKMEDLGYVLAFS